MDYTLIKELIEYAEEYQKETLLIKLKILQFGSTTNCLQAEIKEHIRHTMNC
jgi:hypothetical protein